MREKVLLTGFQFVPKKKKPKRNTKCTNLVYCLCKQTDNGYVALINTSKEKTVLEFTPKSYELKNRLVVFTRKLDKHNKPICVYRSEMDAKLSPGLSIQYTPFCHNQIYSGYIFKKEDKYYFEMKEYIGPLSNYQELLNEKITLNEHK